MVEQAVDLVDLMDCLVSSPASNLCICPPGPSPPPVNLALFNLWVLEVIKNLAQNIGRQVNNYNLSNLRVGQIHCPSSKRKALFIDISEHIILLSLLWVFLRWSLLTILSSIYIFLIILVMLVVLVVLVRMLRAILYLL